jgi:hypothetical protein
MSIPAPAAIVMVGGAGVTPQERLILAAQQAAARDLVAQLQGTAIAPIIVAAPDRAWLPEIPGIVWDEDDPAVPFMFGERLAALITRYALDSVLYFGGGSAPLLDDTTLTGMIDLINRAGRDRDTPHLALTNNIHSSDWLVLTGAQAALRVIRSVDRDNSLAWLLDQSGGYHVRPVAGLRAAAGLDLDTPADVAIAAAHPELKPHLAAMIREYPQLNTLPVGEIIRIAATPESNLTLIGRVSPQAWQALNAATQSWVRVFAEERGMVASGRLQRGEVKSLVGELLRLQGPHTFFQALSELTDAALIDSRPLMAARGLWPTDADRFASDLHLTDAITDPWLRDFTQAALEAPIPILLGGHSVVAGGLFALVEVIQRQGQA